MPAALRAWLQAPRAFGLVAVVSLGAVAAALVSQHVYGMEPCPWCVLQRLVFVAMAAMALLGLAWRNRMGTLVAALAIDALATAGVAAALWQHFVAAASHSCNLTLADKVISGLGLDGALPEIFQPRASCADSAVSLFGLPYEAWSLGLFLILGFVGMRLVMPALRQRPE